ncbi:hypothetical protein RvY_03668 [Ramazzottius varieornatus]|uniref:Uncharacterized protein n=1 Tax=Ramazzottius varieornatus TaxID=947166 RepID=A0A1D1US82_RAMVA|nr:hypothetical protein RvY_03668 [Ramazzottius varieornatus]
MFRTLDLTSRLELSARSLRMVRVGTCIKLAEEVLTRKSCGLNPPATAANKKLWMYLVISEYVCPRPRKAQPGPKEKTPPRVAIVTE